MINNITAHLNNITSHLKNINNKINLHLENSTKETSNETFQILNVKYDSHWIIYSIIILNKNLLKHKNDNKAKYKAI